MSLKIVKGQEIKVQYIKLLLYGESGTGKTSLALTAKNPILFDFDEGSYRSYQKANKNIVPVNSYSQFTDNFESDCKNFDTVIVDTVGTLIEWIRMYCIEQNPKIKSNQMLVYTAIKDEFKRFYMKLKSMKKNLILIAHTTETEKNGKTKTDLNIEGKARTIVRESADFSGYMFFDNNKRILNFSSSDYYDGKNCANLPKQTVPDLDTNPTYFQGIIEQFMTHINGSIEKQNEALELLESWRTNINSIASLDNLSDYLVHAHGLEPALKAQVWSMFKSRANIISPNARYDRQSQRFFEEEPKPKEPETELKPEPPKPKSNVPPPPFTETKPIQNESEQHFQSPPPPKAKEVQQTAAKAPDISAQVPESSYSFD